jgi:hypothetical protein
VVGTHIVKKTRATGVAESDTSCGSTHFARETGCDLSWRQLFTLALSLILTVNIYDIVKSPL